MKNDKSKNIIIALLVVIIIILGGLVVLFATDTISFNSNKIDANNTQENSSSDNELNNENVSNENKITQNQLEKIMENELYIVTNRNTGRNTIKSISDIDNSDLLTLAFNLFEKSSNNTTVSKTQIEEILKDTCLCNLSVEFKTFDVYALNNDTYTKDENIMSKRNLYYGEVAAYKTVSFTEKNEQYTLSVKNIFIDNGDSGDRGQYGYGSMDDLKNSKNSIVEVYNFETNETIDVQKYLDDNFENIKDKLATYNYVFENQNDKVVLVDFYIN